MQSGKQLWKTSFRTTGAEKPYQGFQALHGFASSTPATDGQAVYAFFGRDGVVAVSLEGKRLWQTNVGTETDGWGTATSPVLFENLVIVNASVESGQLVALDKKTGRQVWQAAGHGPVLEHAGAGQDRTGSVELAVSTKNDVLGFDPKTGKQLWSCEAVKDYICPSVVAHDGVVYAIGGTPNTAIAVKAGGRGDVTESHRLWEYSQGIQRQFARLLRRLFVLGQREPGARLLRQCQDGEIGLRAASGAAGRKVLRLAGCRRWQDLLGQPQHGTYVLAAQPEFKQIAHNPPLDDSIFNASPAVADGKLLIRSDKFLYCLAPVTDRAGWCP